MKLQRKQHGFTIVELLIVIVVIGILAALVITTFVGIQQKARDTKRQTDIKALHGQIEAYQAQYGKYPSLANINDSTWRSTNMKGLDPSAIKDPKDPSATPALQATAGANTYAYITTPSTCTNASDGSSDCTSYKLIATLEAGGTFEKDSLN